jgi:hypothetical protein
MDVETERLANVVTFTEGQRHFLGFHRNAVLLSESMNRPTSDDFAILKPNQQMSQP